MNDRNQSDEELMGRAKEGNSQAFDELVLRYQKRVWSVIHRLLQGAVSDPREEANDLAQETFIKAWCARHSYDESKGKFSSWLSRIATNTTIDFLRNRGASWWRSLLSLDETIEDEEGKETAREEFVPSSAPGPEEVTLLNELKEQVRRCLAKLTPAERAALVMRHVEERTLQEIADALCIVGSGRHVQATRFIKRAEKKFRRCYEGGNEI
jgi:RNA polymerase sigma-70 factor (ECF subfamily)